MTGDRAGYGIWTYAIGEDGGAPVPPLAGLAGTGVRTVTGAGLRVLVSDVPLAEFGETALRENLDNLQWLEEVARRHHAVIDAASRLFPLLPARLATVYSGDAALRAVLADRAGPLRDALRRVGDRAEWGVKAYPVARAGPPDAGRDGTGRGYLKMRQAQLTAARDTRAAAAAGARAVHAELAGRAAAARLHPPQVPQLSGSREPMLLNAAYLLDASDRTSFAAAVEGAAAAHPELRIELTGPWPPYSFAGEDDGALG